MQNMKSTALPVHTGFKKIFTLQLIIVAVTAVAYYFYQNIFSAESALYGGAMALNNLWITERRLRSASRIVQIAPEKEAMLLYAGAVQRFVFTLIFFVAGMWWLKLNPIALIVTFSLAQAAFLFKGDAK